MTRLAAVGNRAFVTALAGAGAEPVRCESEAEFSAVLRRLAMQRELRIVFAPESYIMQAPEAVAAFRGRSKAALLGLPLRPSGEHPSLAEMRHIVELATGATLI